MAKEKEKKVRQKINWKKEMKLAPGYIVIILWVIFTFMLLGWILAASLSTTTDIFAGKALKFPTGLHFENYVQAWGSGGAEYKNYFPEDIPAIIVAAGPSLKKNVDLLKEVKGKAVTIVVDSAINTVMAHGIVPDFAITVDTNKELKNFTAEELSDVFLLADATANTKALDMVKSKNLVFYSSDSATWQRMFREEGSSITEVFAGGDRKSTRLNSSHSV